MKARIPDLKLRRLFSVNHLVVEDIDDALTQLGLLSKPLEAIRGVENESENTSKKSTKQLIREKFWQVFYLVNVYSDAARWLLIFLVELASPEITPENIRMKKMWGDFGFFTGGIPAFVHFMVFMLMVAGSVFATLFAYAEYYDRKYL